MRWTLTVSLCLACLVGVGRPAEKPYEDPALTAEQRAHWSFVPPKRPALPEVVDHGWAKNPIDRFVLAKLEANGLRPSPEADRLTLVRRLSFDLTGLPPTPAEIDAYVADETPLAYERLVDRLLASPHYGERWAQHWLDVVRFAESNGYEADEMRPHAWRYRDYVIRSLNADMPYDRFLTEQLAGDLLATGREPREAAELHVAAGYLRCGPVHVVGGNTDREEQRQEVMTEMVNNVGSAVLGLTLGCARCHDHKFDPLSLGDYYRFQAYFAGTFERQLSLNTEAEKPLVDEESKRLSEAVAGVRRGLDAIEAPHRAKLREAKRAALDEPTRAAFAVLTAKRTPAEVALVKAAEPTVKVAWDEVLPLLSPEDRAKRDPLVQQLEDLRRTSDEKTLSRVAWTVRDEKSTPECHILRRGDVRKKTGLASPAPPRVTMSAKVAAPSSAKNRLDLAREVTRADHPLTARVLVNRLWRHHFGRGIVDTPNDFGSRGDAPTHPELLDWLARELVAPTVGEHLADERAWTLKRVHRLMVTSATYRQRGTPRDDLGVKDPANLWLGRMNRRRLDAESLRDAMLATAGTLNRDLFGPSVRVPLEPEVYDLIFSEDEPIGLWPVTSDARQHTRRSLYLMRKRNVRLPLLEAFDQPDTLNSCAARGESTFAPQALILMNGPLTATQTVAMAADVRREAGNDGAARVAALYRRALGRLPRGAELAACLKFLEAQPGERGFVNLCKAVVNTSEFAYAP